MDRRPPSIPSLTRRDFQFSLGRLLVAMTLCAVVFAFRLPTFYTVWAVVATLMVALFSDWSVWHQVRAGSALRARDYGRAIEAFSKAIRAKPEDPERYCHRAVAHQWNEDLDAARADYARAVDLDTRYAPAWIGRANVALAQGDLEWAVDDATIALCLAPGSLDALLVRSTACYGLGRLDDALADAEEAVRSAPEHWQPWNHRAGILLSARRHEAALADLDEAVRLGAPSRDLLAARSLALFRLGRHDEAFRGIEACLADDPRSPHARCILAWFLATCPDDSLRDGRRALEIARSVEPTDDGGAFARANSLAAACAEMGYFDEAIEHARRALDLAPAAARAVCELRLATYRAGQPYRDLGQGPA